MLTRLLFSFRGRIGRTSFLLTSFVVASIGAFALIALHRFSPSDTAITTTVVLATFWPLSALQFKRLHDRGVSGFVVAGFWLIFIPFAGLAWIADDAAFPGIVFMAGGVLQLLWMAILVFLTIQWFWPGSKQPNRFGPPVEARPRGERPSPPQIGSDPSA